VQASRSTDVMDADSSELEAMTSDDEDDDLEDDGHVGLIE
jgi:hypothetical protein